MAIEFDYSPMPFPELGQPRDITIMGPSAVKLLGEAKTAKVEAAVLARVYQRLGDDMIGIGGTDRTFVLGDKKNSIEIIDFMHPRFRPFEKYSDASKKPVIGLEIKAEDFDVLAEVANIYQCTVEDLFERFINVGTYVTEGIRNRKKTLFTMWEQNGRKHLKYHPLVIPQ